MKINACRICKKLFNDYNDHEICPVCEKNYAEESKRIKESKLIKKQRLMAILTYNVESDGHGYEEVKEYINTHPTANLIQISKETKVSSSAIVNWVREDRLQFSEDSKEAWLTCECCGNKIPSGRFCIRCRNI
ncbi:hypothetical protein [Anaeromicropila herbilytica]|uniref:Flagellar protein n=1 Tax=Anaeromicropila herbilytica TaxID=2785025 RepID=A0A7R7EID8_9FIRM|nr:hypothetical protein [Anaeromicropila herbilytica]BCN29740.1 hypothetical protein bsdtb5_10350 [Anaeromicropila herbilytica]